MDNFPTSYHRQGTDGESDCPYHIYVSPLNRQNYYYNDVVQELNIDKYEHFSRIVRNPIPGSNPDVTHWELRIRGKLCLGFEQELMTRLESKHVPLAIRNHIVTLIANDVLCRPAILFPGQQNIIVPTIVSVGVYATIQLYNFEYEEEGEEEEDEEDQEFISELESYRMMVLGPTSTMTSTSRRVIIEALEKVRVKGKERETECAVCLEEFSVGLEAMRLPCSHVFHGDCVVRWLENRGVCPLCRYELSSSAKETTFEARLS